MATYIPNATQTTEPVESRTVESAALEFRTLKTSITARIEDVQDGLDTEIVNRIAGDANLQTQNNAQDVRLTAIENALLSIGEGGLPGTVYVQRFSGTGAQTAFTLNAAPQSGNVVDIYVNGLYQNKDTFSVAGAVITFSEAPPAGTDNIEVQVTVTIALGETDASLVTYNATTVEAQLDSISAAGGSSLVGFQQAGTGALVRTVQDKLRECVSVKDFGAVGDYYLSDGVTANPTPTDDSGAIIAAYNWCLANNKRLVIEGDFYIEHTVRFITRTTGGSRRMIVECAATFYANLDASGDADAVYAGDDTADGIYPLKIDGWLSIENVGSVKTGKHGLHCQDAAYGYYNVVCSGFDVGIFVQGVIYAVFDGKNRACSNNNLDVRIESYKPTNPIPVLRLTNNLTEFRDMKFISSNKVYIKPGASVVPPTYHSGGLMKFVRCLFEGNTGDPGANNTGYTFYAEALGEVVPGVIGEIELDHCWFESFYPPIPLIGINGGRLVLNHCFFAMGNSASKFIELLDDDSFVDFKNTSAYFGDALPASGCVVSRGGTATDRYRSNITVSGNSFYGPGGLLPPLHDGMPYKHLQNYSTPAGTFYLRMRFFQSESPAYPPNAQNDYMQNATLDVQAFLTEMFGTQVDSADIYIKATDGTSSSYTHVKYFSGQAFLVTNTDARLTLVGNELRWPTDIQGAFYRPIVSVHARISQIVSPVPV